VARIGGEEFAIVLPEVGYQVSLEVASNVRQAIAQAPVKIGKKERRCDSEFWLMCNGQRAREDNPRTCD
jgi:PleD family two-component response regulator